MLIRVLWTITGLKTLSWKLPWLPPKATAASLPKTCTQTIVVASDCATFALPEVDRGAMGGGAHLQRLFPVQKVRYLFFTGEKITAQEADRYGFIERIVPKAELRAAALEIARKIAAKSPSMIRIAKEALNGIEDGNLEDKYRWEQGFTLQAYTSPDSAETRRAFVEKREVKF